MWTSRCSSAAARPGALQRTSENAADRHARAHAQTPTTMRNAAGTIIADRLPGDQRAAGSLRRRAPAAGLSTAGQDSSGHPGLPAGTVRGLWLSHGLAPRRRQRPPVRRQTRDCADRRRMTARVSLELTILPRCSCPQSTQVPQRRHHVCMAANVIIRTLGVTLGQPVESQLRV